METKREDALPEEKLHQDDIPQTEINPEFAEMDPAFPAEGEALNQGISQTDSENSLEEPPSEEFSAEHSEKDDDSQTETESAGILDKMTEESPGTSEKQASPQTEPEKPKRRGRPRKTAEEKSQSDTEPASGTEHISDGVMNAPQPRKKRPLHQTDFDGSAH